MYKIFLCVPRTQKILGSAKKKADAISYADKCAEKNPFLLGFFRVYYRGKAIYQSK